MAGTANLHSLRVVFTLTLCGSLRAINGSKTYEAVVIGSEALFEDIAKSTGLN
jgi:hypothetical protein